MFTVSFVEPSLTLIEMEHKGNERKSPSLFVYHAMKRRTVFPPCPSTPGFHCEVPKRAFRTHGSSATNCVFTCDSHVTAVSSLNARARPSNRRGHGKSCEATGCPRHCRSGPYVRRRTEIPFHTLSVSMALRRRAHVLG